ncbi:4Fe-4S dicluster domain-containing protein [bacterium]|nr:4Fe-4S dicluster domain-containing protein [bacterium]
MKGVIVVDVEKCLACKSCEMACALVHSKSKDLFKAIREQPLPQSRIRVEEAEGFSLPLQCRHCQDAPCVSICPTQAIQKTDSQGPVIIKDILCIGCKWCLLVCPYGVLTIGHQGRAITNCDLCWERLKQDEEPACVQACPTKALQFIPLEKLTPEEIEKRTKEFLVHLGEK